MTQTPDLTWDDNEAPYSNRFQDRYFSVQDGRQESSAVFLAGNDLPDRWKTRDHFHIAELGFGTGLNFFETVHQWQTHAPATARLNYTSFELFPLSGDEMARALSNWPDLAGLARLWLKRWPPNGPFLHNKVELNLIIADARSELSNWNGQADAWYLDGFSPARNPQLWEENLMQDVFDHTQTGGTFSTYTAAGFVRRNLQNAGFDVQRVQGFGGKRERLQGRRK